MSAVSRGSQIATAGFKNEKDVRDELRNYQTSSFAQDLLKNLGYDMVEITTIKAEIISGAKTDLHLEILTATQTFQEFLQVKLVSIRRGFNQVDKRWVDVYQKSLNMPIDVATLLKHFTGELPPKSVRSRSKSRMFMDEFSENEREKILSFLIQNKREILNMIFRGSGSFAANQLLVVEKNRAQPTWHVFQISEVISNLSNLPIKISPRGSISFCGLTIQRKGGDGGKRTAQMLQFKLDPLMLLELKRTGRWN